MEDFFQKRRDIGFGAHGEKGTDGCSFGDSFCEPAAERTAFGGALIFLQVFEAFVDGSSQLGFLVGEMHEKSIRVNEYMSIRGMIL